MTAGSYFGRVEPQESLQQPAIAISSFAENFWPYKQGWKYFGQNAKFEARIQAFSGALGSFKSDFGAEFSPLFQVLGTFGQTWTAPGKHN